MGRSSEFTDLALLDLLLNFSPLPAMTNSGWSESSLLCLLRRMNQKRANEASNTTTIGTTMAGISVLRLDDGASVVAPAVARDVEEALEEVGSVVEDEESAAADVMEAYSRASVIVLVRTEVTVLGTGPVRASVCVSIMVVKPEGASAETTEAMAVGSVTTSDGTMVAGRVSVGGVMLEGRSSKRVSCLLRRA